MTEYYAITRSDDFLEHYGIKGMKWGVRKAIQSGNTRALGRQYRKAQRKLAKLEKRANSGAKYARRAAALGAGAGLLGAGAAVGTGGVSRAVGALGGAGGVGMNKAGRLLSRSRNPRLRAAGAALQKSGAGLAIGAGKASRAIKDYGGATSIADRLTRQGGAASAIRRNGANDVGRQLSGSISEKMRNSSFNTRGVTGTKGAVGNFAGGRKIAAKTATRDLTSASINNNRLLRLGAAAGAAGLAGAAGYNAYRAATTKRAARKAAQFRSEMNKAFAGTQYANGGRGGNRRRRRR